MKNNLYNFDRITSCRGCPAHYEHGCMLNCRVIKCLNGDIITRQAPINECYAPITEEELEVFLKLMPSSKKFRRRDKKDGSDL